MAHLSSTMCTTTSYVSRSWIKISLNSYMAFLNTLSSEKSSSILAAHILTLMEANHDDKINMMLYLKMKPLQLLIIRWKFLMAYFFAMQKSSFFIHSVEKWERTIHFHIVVTRILREFTFDRSEFKEVLYVYFCNQALCLSRNWFHVKSTRNFSV